MSKGREAHQQRIQQVNAFGKELARRSKSRCELCGENTSLSIYEVPPVNEPDLHHCVMICENCRNQIEGKQRLEPNHWHNLTQSVWSEVPAVQVLAVQMLQRLKNEGWAQDLLDEVYLEPDVQAWVDLGI